MGGLYILMALIIIIVNINQLPHVLAQIFKGAFGLQAPFGAIVGSTVAWGVKRGVYSNEAGQGTGPQASSAAEVSHPAKQGFVQAFSVYVDTLFVCSATGFMILMTGCYNTFNEFTKNSPYNLPSPPALYIPIPGVNSLRLLFTHGEYSLSLPSIFSLLQSIPTTMTPSFPFASLLFIALWISYIPPKAEVSL